MSNYRSLKGAAAVEFALVLPVFLFMMYGMVVYAYMFVLQESLTFAAQAAAEATVKVDPAVGGGYEAAVINEARAAASRVLDFLPEDQQQRVLGSNGENVAVSLAPAASGLGSIVTVSLSFAFDGLFPVLNLPGLGAIPPMPETLQARASTGL